MTIIIICALLSWEQNPCISLCTLHGHDPLSTRASTNTFPAVRLQVSKLEPVKNWQFLLMCDIFTSTPMCIDQHAFVFFFMHYVPLHLFNPLNPELNPICYLLALLGAHHFLHVTRIRVKLLTFRLLMSYMYIWSTHS